MYTKEQDILLGKFADANDELFNLGITTTDSFTGEIGEFVACKHFNLKKSARSNKAVDGVCELGNEYQIKAKIIANNFNYNITNLDTSAFKFLIVVYFDKHYNPIKILKIPSNKIQNSQISITSKVLKSGIEIVESNQIKISQIAKNALNQFASIYNGLVESDIIRSRRIVGDIGEYYACKHLELEISKNRNEKGFDARDKNGLTFEIKTRRVYQSDRRISETRRLNNLVGKSADFLIVVTIDRVFKCSGMWLIPMKNITNPKSANLKIVNSSLGVKNLIPSKIAWLNSGEKFLAFNSSENLVAKKIIKPSKVKRIYEATILPTKPKFKQALKKKQETKLDGIGIFIISIFIIYLICILLS